MKMMKLGSSDIEVSKLCLGTISYGRNSSFTVKELSELLDVCLDNGINLIDTAPIYNAGASELMLGEALVGKRDKFIIQSKCGVNWRGVERGYSEGVRDGNNIWRDLTPEAIRIDLEDSLKRLKTDYIDVMIPHRQSFDVPIAETAGELNRMVEQGKVRRLGISNVTVAQAEQYCENMQVDVMQLKYSMVVPRYLERMLPVLRKYNLTYQPWQLLESGGLVSRAIVDSAGDDDPRSRLAVMYLKSMRPYAHRIFDVLEDLAAKYNRSTVNIVMSYTDRAYENMNLLSGTENKDEIIDNAKAFDFTLSEDDLSDLKAVADDFIANIPDDYPVYVPANEDA